MKTIMIDPWKVYYDNIATLEAYCQIPKGYSEICKCDHCFNFLKVRDELYPAMVKDFFMEMGIDYTKEAEVAHVRKIQPGLHYYWGWFHFIGNVERSDEKKHPCGDERSELTKINGVKVNENFSWSFSSGKDWPRNEAFKGQITSQIDFFVNVPWVIDAKEPA